MENSEDKFAIAWDKVQLILDGKKVEYPLLRIKISGTPSITEFANLMLKIESFTQDYEQDYIALTDFSEIYPNKITEILISISSSKLIRSMTYVSHQSIMSFVVLGKDEKFALLKKQLEDINNAGEEKAYSYNYFFIEDESLLAGIAEKYLAEHRSQS